MGGLLSISGERSQPLSLTDMPWAAASWICRYSCRPDVQSVPNEASAVDPQSENCAGISCMRNMYFGYLIGGYTRLGMPRDYTFRRQMRVCRVAFHKVVVVMPTTRVWPPLRHASNSRSDGAQTVPRGRPYLEALLGADLGAVQVRVAKVAKFE